MIFAAAMVSAQDYWQQKVNYVMQIDVDATNFTYDGDMTLTYTNNSPDTLRTVYYHLYFNAFQPGSVMDNRLKHIPDPDRRMMNNLGTRENPNLKSRIAQLSKADQGRQDIKSIHQNGQELRHEEFGTILRVDLAQPILPNTSTDLKMKWRAQVPSQIRRSGKQSAEGIDFSMTQWYPKMAAYDAAGWHLDEYVGREFYAPFGDFDVKILLPENYIVGSSGELQNENQMPGYSNSPQKLGRNQKRTWHFKASNIHDFAWAADPSYVVDKQVTPSGVKLYYLYDRTLDAEYIKNWKDSQPLMTEFFEFMTPRFGAYPWTTYTIVQGGDGGMEYGTSTLITGRRSLRSLVGVMIHEAAHSWFQHLFGIDETQHEWMDEGFTTYVEAMAAHHILGEKQDAVNIFEDAYRGYYNLVESGLEEPMSLLADYFNHNYAYGISAYYKGQVFPAQLGYIIGENNLRETFLRFYDQWKFKHPTPTDFVKIAQDVSGINLKWYENLFTKTTRHIDYGIDLVSGNQITLRNHSNFPMPLDVLVTFTDGSQHLYYIPANEMRGVKICETEFYPNIKNTTLPAWQWSAPTYTVQAAQPVKSVQIDPTQRLADVNAANNTYPAP